MSRMDQYVTVADSIATSLTAVKEEFKPNASAPFHFCSWVHNRLPGSCDQNQSETPRHVVNDVLCTHLNVRPANCSEQLCNNSLTSY